MLSVFWVSGPEVAQYRPVPADHRRMDQSPPRQSMLGSRVREDAGPVGNSCMDTVCKIPCGQVVPTENSASFAL